MQAFLLFWMFVGLYSMWAAGTHNWGWLVGVLFNLVWCAYAISIGEWALATQNVAFSLVLLRNFIVGLKK